MVGKPNWQENAYHFMEIDPLMQRSQHAALQSNHQFFHVRMLQPLASPTPSPPICHCFLTNLHWPGRMKTTIITDLNFQQSTALKVYNTSDDFTVSVIAFPKHKLF
jgi:hypothetical protein